MEERDIDIFDLKRIALGDVPGEFYIELILRSVFMYVLIVLGMRFMGKRATAQLGRSEMAAVATLAAAGGLALLTPDRGLLPPLIILGVMLSIKWWVNWKNYRDEKMEFITEGKYNTLVKDGIIQLHEMKKARISKEQLFARLREKQVIHLGEVKRLFLEANGTFSLLRNSEAAPGLAVIPSWDTNFLAEQVRSNRMVCTNCGAGFTAEAPACPECRSAESACAVSVPEAEQNA